MSTKFALLTASAALALTLGGCVANTPPPMARVIIRCPPGYYLTSDAFGPLCQAQAAPPPVPAPERTAIVPYVAPPPVRVPGPSPPVQPAHNDLPAPPQPDPKPLRSVDDDPPPLLTGAKFKTLEPPADATVCKGWWRTCHFYWN
ncbi:MAG: hypothetical protein ABSC06_34240 [Rhodopila sp.]